MFAPARGDETIFSRPLGDVIYCVGLTSDFRTRALATVEAHICLLARLLASTTFESLLYLSSTRLYIRNQAASEDGCISVDPGDPEDIFNITKLAGESICLSQGNPRVRIARLSNVLGEDYESGNFIFSLIKDARQDGVVELRTTPESAKDYVLVDDVVRLLPKIAESGKRRLYNVASGSNLSNAEILGAIAEVTGARIKYAEKARHIAFPRIDNQSICSEFGYVPSPILPAIRSLALQFPG